MLSAAPMVCSCQKLSGSITAAMRPGTEGGSSMPASRAMAKSPWLAIIPA